MIVNI